ncbi:MAG: hypothetical protein JEZ12_16105 [Desulfobacterium sp.]|nr:hypothetical protein [Desulfobacterium sp.]
METADYFRKAVQDYLKDKPRGAQKKLAEKSGITSRHLNDFLGHRRAMKEQDRVRIAEAMDSDYLDLLIHGKNLIKKIKVYPPEKEAVNIHKAMRDWRNKYLKTTVETLSKELNISKDFLFDLLDVSKIDNELPEWERSAMDKIMDDYNQVVDVLNEDKDKNVLKEPSSTGQPLLMAMKILDDALKKTKTELSDKQKEAAIKVLIEDLQKAEDGVKDSIKRYLSILS